jgi:hypothetical protein
MYYGFRPLKKCPERDNKVENESLNANDAGKTQKQVF